MKQRIHRHLSLGQLERREVLSVTFVDSGQVLGDSESSAVALGDVDGDGDLDAFVSNGTVGDKGAQANKVWLNDGTGVFADSGQILESDFSSTHIALYDLDSDGDLDAFVVEEDFLDGPVVACTLGEELSGLPCCYAAR